MPGPTVECEVKNIRSVRRSQKLAVLVGEPIGGHTYPHLQRQVRTVPRLLRQHPGRSGQARSHHSAKMAAAPQGGEWRHGSGSSIWSNGYIHIETGRQGGRAPQE